MSERSSYEDYLYIMGILTTGNTEQLEETAAILDDFPDGKDHFIRRHWIVNAIDCGSLESIRWMLAKKVDLGLRADDGYIPLLSAIDRDGPDRYQVIELLLEHGAPIDAHGINDWTALHMAAARDDVEVCKLLVRFGADTSIRTNIDDYATPLEEARILGCENAIKYLQSLES